MSNLRFLVPRRLRVGTWTAVCMVGLGGCAQVPSWDNPVEKRSIEQFASEHSFSAPVAAWPAEEWWRRYGDPQLDTLIQEALRDAPDLAIAQARLRHADGVAQSAGAAMIPQVTGNAAVTQEKLSYNYLSPKAALPQDWNDYGRAILDFSWELDFWGKNRSALVAATSAQQATRAELAQARLILSTSVALAYSELAHLYVVRDTAEAALAVRTRTTELIADRYRADLETLGSVRQMESRQAAAQTELLAIDERIALQKNALAALAGAGPDRGLAIEQPTAAFHGGIGLPPVLAADLLGRRPDIAAARLRVEAAAKRADAQKAGFYPSVNLLSFVGKHSLGLDNLAEGASSVGSVGLAVSLPIFNTRNLQGQLRGARADYDTAVAIYNGTLIRALREVADVTASRKALDAQLASQRASVAAATEAHRIVSDRYRGELSTYLDVLSAEDALLSSKHVLADLETRALFLDIALTRALGGGYRAGSNVAVADTHQSVTHE